MNKELKLRAYPKTGRHCDWAMQKVVCIDLDNKEIIVKNKDRISRWLPMDDFHLMEYVGLYNNKIYEDDIVKCSLTFDGNNTPSYAIMGKIVWVDSRAAFGIIDKDNKRLHWPCIGLNVDFLDNIEPVGNIHENPELL